MANTVNDIYHRIGQRIVDSIDKDWTKSKLDIEYIGSVKTHLSYSTSNEEKNNTSLVDSFNNARDVASLHKITTEDSKNKWNKAIFTLMSDGKFDMEFVWDQELQDEVESFSED